MCEKQVNLARTFPAICVHNYDEILPSSIHASGTWPPKRTQFGSFLCLVFFSHWKPFYSCAAREGSSIRAKATFVCFRLVFCGKHGSPSWILGRTPDFAPVLSGVLLPFRFQTRVLSPLPTPGPTSGSLDTYPQSQFGF